VAGEVSLKWIDDNQPAIIEMSDEVWRLAEVGLQELESARIQAEMLAAAGFTVESGLAGMPAAFVASWGEGGPVVALLGEYDALPGTSNKNTPCPDPLVAGGAGHACGHNLLGAAAVAAAIAAKAEMQARGIKGTVRYYGCPAEENAGGKTYMVRDGLFGDVDAALTWHPSALNGVRLNSSLANRQAKFHYTGRTAHAAGNPEMGRSALDAVELMNIGVNYLREHIISEARIHYVTTNGGGEPNVVPGEAESWYYIRAPRLRQLREIYDRVIKIANGAAMMTETELAVKFTGGCANVVPNQPLAEALYRNMQRVGAPVFDGSDVRWATDISKHYPAGQREAMLQRLAQMGLDLGDAYLHDSIAPFSTDRSAMAGSTDVGDVSWVTPTAQFSTACSPLGSSGHSWQITAASGMGIGHKGMIAAAKVLALTALEVLEDAQLLAKARQALVKERGGEEYVSLIPAEVKEPVDPFEGRKH
jgi:aminobenzoyl-glutamate utilization protein B